MILVFTPVSLILFSFSFTTAKNDSKFYLNQLVSIDANLTTVEIIRRQGYPAKLHKFKSEDDYILGYHRIPHGKTKTTSWKQYPVILNHGLLSSSIDWIVNGPEKSLAYRLADEGFDVWIANARGTPDSKAHISMKPRQREFWNFTFHEMGKYDVSAAINYILNVTNAKKVIHIGHSQGTTIFYAFATTRPEMADKVLVHLSFAPVTTIPNSKSLFTAFVPIMKQIQSTGLWYRLGSFLEYSPAITSISEYYCGSKNRFPFNICEQLVNIIGGRDDEQFQREIVLFMLHKLPSGTSTKNMVHSSQTLTTDKFAQFDYGKTENLKIYGQNIPPVYDFKKIRIPVRLYFGINDLTANPRDTETLYRKLPKPAGCILVPYPKWNHVDFLWAKDVNQLFNEELLQFLQNATKNEKFIEKLVAASIDEPRKCGSSTAYKDENMIPLEDLQWSSVELLKRLENTMHDAT